MCNEHLKWFVAKHLTTTSWLLATATLVLGIHQILFHIDACGIKTIQVQWSWWWYAKDGHMSNQTFTRKGLHAKNFFINTNLWQKEEEIKLEKWRITSAKSGHGWGKLHGGDGPTARVAKWHGNKNKKNIFSLHQKESSFIFWKCYMGGWWQVMRGLWAYVHLTGTHGYGCMVARFHECMGLVLSRKKKNSNLWRTPEWIGWFVRRTS